MPKAGSWAVEGIGEDFVPPNCDLSLVNEAYSISDRDSFAAARDLLRQEGILAGSSTGTLLAAALRYCRAQSEPKRVVTWSATPAPNISPRCSTGLSRAGGLATRSPRHGPRFVSSPLPEGTEVVVRPKDNLRTVFARMRAADVSQLPVVEGDRIVGLVDESDVLGAVLTARPGGFRRIR